MFVEINVFFIEIRVKCFYEDVNQCTMLVKYLQFFYCYVSNLSTYYTVCKKKRENILERRLE